MGFRVDITEPALADAEAYVRSIREVNREPDAADGWFLGLFEAIFSLEASPERCAMIPESDELSVDVRRLIDYSRESRLGLSRYDLLQVCGGDCLS